MTPPMSEATFFAFLPEAVISIDPEQRIMFANPRVEEIFGYPPGELLGQPLDILLPEPYRAAHRTHVHRFLHADEPGRLMGQRSEITGRRRDATVFPAEASFFKTGAGDNIRLTAIVRDISHRKERENRLAAAEARHRAILETSSDAILLADVTTGRIKEVNARAAELFGCAARDLVGLHQAELHPPESREHYRRTFREHLDNDRVLVPDAEIQRCDGSVVPVEIAARPVSIGGELTMVGFFRDISRWKARERELLAARRAAEAANEAKTRFIASMNHELRTPLNAIIGFAELIYDQVHGPIDDPSYVEAASAIRDAGQHLHAMVDDILTMNSLQMGEYHPRAEWLDLAGTVRRCCKIMQPAATDAAVELAAEVPAGCRLHADAKALRQMLFNLLANAVKFTPRGGRVSIAAGPAAGGRFAVAVTDTGVGIRPDQLPRVTEAFNRTNDPEVANPDGLGLGLAITKGLIEAHGGELDIVSEVARGTTVRLIFPADRVTSEETRSA